jgi:hypothetical protein
MARKSKHRPEKARVAIVGDGETEQIYFANVKDKDRPIDIDIFPELPAKRGSYKNVLKKATLLALEYTKVIALIDMDTVNNDNLEKEYIQAKKMAEQKGIVVLENNPCFEIWLLLHFINTSRSFTNCEQVSDELKKSGRIPGYEKAQRFLIAAGLYAKFKDRIPTHAIPAARRLEQDRAEKGKRHPRAEIFRFFEWYILPDRLQQLQRGEAFRSDK